jgi:hypothetical protein
VTWAYNTHCHHCQLNMRAFDRRKAWGTMNVLKYLVGGLVVMGAVAFAAKAQGAEFEIVPYKPASAQQAAGKRPAKVGAVAFVKELEGIRAALGGALMKPESWPTMARQINALAGKAKALFGEEAPGAPYAACNQAADELLFTWQSASGLVARRQQPDHIAAAALARYATNFGDAYRSCRTLVDALPG